MSARWLRRIAREEQGAFLVEIMVSALLLVMLTAGVIASFDVAQQQSGHQRAQAIAANLAQTELDRLRSLRFSDLLTYATPVAQAPKNVGGIEFTVTSQSQSALAPQAGAAGCDISSKSPEALRVTATVTWPRMNGRQPVRVSSVIAAPVGGDSTRGTFTVQVVNREGVGVPALPISMAGASSVGANTDENGCVRFTDMLPGSYTLSFSRANWFTTPDGRTTVSDTVTVVAAQAGTKTYQYDPGGPLKATFFYKLDNSATTYASKVKGVTWEHPTFNGPKRQSYSTEQTQVQATNPDNYPLHSVKYGVYADTCDAARPDISPWTVTTLDPGDTPVQVQLPALNITADNADSSTVVYTTSPCTNWNNVTLATVIGPRPMTRIGTSSTWRVADAGYPFGEAYAVCVRRGDGRYLLKTSGVSNIQKPKTDVYMGNLNSGTQDQPGKLCGQTV